MLSLMIQAGYKGSDYYRKNYYMLSVDNNTHIKCFTLNNIICTSLLVLVIMNATSNFL